MVKKRNAAFGVLQNILDAFSVNSLKIEKLVQTINDGFVLQTHEKDKSYAIKVLYSENLANKEKEMIGFINEKEKIKKYIVPYFIYTKDDDKFEEIKNKIEKDDKFKEIIEENKEDEKIKKILKEEIKCVIVSPFVNKISNKTLLDLFFFSCDCQIIFKEEKIFFEDAHGGNIMSYDDVIFFIDAGAFKKIEEGKKYKTRELFYKLNPIPETYEEKVIFCNFMGCLQVIYEMIKEEFRNNNSDSWVSFRGFFDNHRNNENNANNAWLRRLLYEINDKKYAKFTNKPEEFDKWCFAFEKIYNLHFKTFENVKEYLQSMNKLSSKSFTYVQTERVLDTLSSEYYINSSKMMLENFENMITDVNKDKIFLKENDPGREGREEVISLEIIEKENYTKFIVKKFFTFSRYVREVRFIDSVKKNAYLKHCFVPARAISISHKNTQLYLIIMPVVNKIVFGEKGEEEIQKRNFKNLMDFSMRMQMTLIDSSFMVYSDVSVDNVCTTPEGNIIMIDYGGLATVDELTINRNDRQYFFRKIKYPLVFLYNNEQMYKIVNFSNEDGVILTMLPAIQSVSKDRDKANDFLFAHAMYTSMICYLGMLIFEEGYQKKFEVAFEPNEEIEKTPEPQVFNKFIRKILLNVGDLNCYTLENPHWRQLVHIYDFEIKMNDFRRKGSIFDNTEIDWNKSKPVPMSFKTVFEFTSLKRALFLTNLNVLSDKGIQGQEFKDM